MSLAEQLSGQVQPCLEHIQCRNGPAASGCGRPVCCGCKFAIRGGGLSNFWTSIGAPSKHPVQIAANRKIKLDLQEARRTKKQNRDRGKMEVQRRAQVAEKRTDRNIIRATKNSGRTDKDADHVMAGRITLDTKNQARVHPIVHVGELEKVRDDARRAGNPIGALVLRNENGHGFVVLAEEDFAMLVKGLR